MLLPAQISPTRIIKHTFGENTALPSAYNPLRLLWESFLETCNARVMFEYPQQAVACFHRRVVLSIGSEPREREMQRRGTVKRVCVVSLYDCRLVHRFGYSEGTSNTRER